ncbi:MAG: DNA topoisomerase I [Candidatus Aenigmarchaeota archaeon]|nr:DNA topoisomerase I [Candidatus Aenigmarchaeota archaeon]
MKSLSHNGIIIPEYKPRGFFVKFKGKEIKLSPEQEEMAIAWVRKLGTPYVEDKVFIKNFFNDFSRALGVKGNVDDFEFPEIIKYVEAQRKKREQMSSEEKKELAAKRKEIREKNKELYGFAEIDGERVALGNYMAEPSGIFMGRGKHPLRGSWKQGAKKSDITLNLSPNAKRPEGNWKEIVWMPECMWIAKWKDMLTGKEKYIWLADTSPMKQKREMKKFDKAKELDKNRPKIREYIQEHLDSNDEKTRKVATVCYLIEKVCMRVGDEKDEDEAETVGASTLAKNHIKIEGNVVKFDFLGKDSVRWVKEIEAPDKVINNLKEFMSGKDDLIFDGIRSENVNEFLGQAMEGLTSKVFRTCSATKAVRDYLDKNPVDENKSEYYKKHVAKLANLQAAMICNHKRTIPASWQKSLENKKERLKAKKAKAKVNIKKYKQKIEDNKKKFELQSKKYQAKLAEAKEKLGQCEGNEKKQKACRKSVSLLNKRIKDIKKKYVERDKKLNEMFAARKQKDKENIRKAELQIEEQEKTKDYNLNTSLKSYVDPRAYYKWFKKSGFDWKKYYSTTLQRKFSWVEKEDKD